MAADSLPLVNLFLPAFLSSVEKSTRQYRYTLYLGFDLEDVVYDDKRKLEQVRKRMVTMIGDYPVDVKAVRALMSLVGLAESWLGNNSHCAAKVPRGRSPPTPSDSHIFCIAPFARGRIRGHQHHTPIFSMEPQTRVV